MFLERQTVSRKTPGDGKLEISSMAAEYLRTMPDALEVELGPHRAPARVEELTCTCQKVGRAHEHHFVASDVLKSLRGGTVVDLQMSAIRDERGERTLMTVLPVEAPAV